VCGGCAFLPRPRQDILGAAALRGLSTLQFLSCFNSNPTTPSEMYYEAIRLIRTYCVYE
jgi:hypothetical protein